ncbi:hypothetical protein OQA88_5418 [Cercophora sp. LCS_1]
MHPLSLAWTSLTTLLPFFSATPSTPPSILATLPPLLSPLARIILPSDPSYDHFNTRWTSGGRPTYTAIVTVSTESDISAVIRYANSHSIPFFATTGGHGSWYGLSSFEGIAIYMRNLTKFVLSDDGKTATFGGGLRGTDVTHGLWKLGKQTVTGACQCVGLMGPALGGGHGFLQGRYGLLTDQIVSARVVLGDGSVVVASETENEGLFWGLRGAGHNFGIVSEVEYRVYDVEDKGDWAWETLVFSGEQLERIYEVSNGMMEGQGEGVVHWSTWAMVVEVDEVNPVIIYQVFYNGKQEELEEYLRPEQGTVSLYPIDVPKYDVPAVREWYNTFRDMTQAEPELAGSFCLLEQYPTQAVPAVPRESTAFAHRDQRLLLYEGWRIEKLKALKVKYDPDNRFGYFAGIIKDIPGDL